MVVVSPFPNFADPSANVISSFQGSTIQDMKSYLQVSLMSSLPSGSAIVKANVKIDNWLSNDSSIVINKNILWNFTGGNAKFIIGKDVSDPNVKFNFVTGHSYKVLFQVSVTNNNTTSTVMYQCVYKFNYVSPTPTLTNFTFDDNISNGDDIAVTGLNIDPSYKALYPTDVPTSFSFQFNELEYVPFDASGNPNVNSENNEGYNPELNYDPSGNYTLDGNTLDNDNFYEVTATATWGTDGYSTSITSSQKLFVIARPSINNIVPYDAQNDGGNDGQGDDGTDQTIATITLDPVGYKNYLPSDVTFIFTDMSDNQIASANLPYDALSEDLQIYDIKLTDISLNDVSVPLLDGMPGYNVVAQVNVPIVINGTSYPTQVRTSDPYSVVFIQGVATILPLTIGNTWDLVSNGVPSDAPDLYNSSPVLGISGYFLKNAQFMSDYSNNLDTTTTKFLLQYTLNGEDPVNVVSAALVQQGPQESKEQAMIRAMGLVVNNVSDGKYTNVVGPSNVNGPDQNPLVFYIPNVQGGVTFGESDVVNVVVTIDSAGVFADVTGLSSPVSAEDDFIMVNKIPTYSYTSGTSMEPYIANVDVDVSNNRVLTNNGVSTVKKTDVLADSKQSIINQTANGWTVVNTGAVNGSVPKVNLYYYNKSMSTSTFTMGDINQDSDLGMWYVIDQNQGAQQYPFLIAYTTPDPSANWYKSKVFYGPAASSVNPVPTPTRSGFTLFYTGTDDETLYPEILSPNRVKLAVNAGLSNPSTPNPGLSGEEVMALSIQTSSNAAQTNAGDFNFTLLYAGVVGNGSYTTTLFTDPNLNVSIPIDTSFSTYSDNTFISNINTPSGGYVKTETSDTVSSSILPVLTETIYTVQYSIKNPNNNNAIVMGLVSDDTTIDTLNLPQLTDFTVANFSFNTINTNTKSSIVFDLSLNPYLLDRIDGVHVYFTSDANSDIPSTLIGTFTTNQVGCEIFLLSDASSNLLGSGSNPQNQDNTAPLLSSQLLWNPYTSATITFVPFRDANVDSAVDQTENLSATFTVPTAVWNIPVIDQPSVSGTISLAGGVVNSDSDTVLNWTNDTGAAYDYPVAFSYVLTIQEGNGSAVPCTVNVLGDAASSTLNIDANNNNAGTDSYSLTLTKVFQGQSSLPDTITFNSVVVNTSVMNVTISNPSNTNSITASWVDLATGISGPNSSFANNVASLCLTDNGDALNDVDDDTIEVSGGSYTISQPMGYIYQLCMSATACVPYSVNGGVLVASSAVPLALGPAKTYTVSTIPNVALVPYAALGSQSSTVLIQNTNTPSLLLNLNAMGLENEGFISLVVVLTQDGTAAKPGGCEVLLQFPPSPTSYNPFLFPNDVGNVGSGNANLVGGETSTATPLNLVPTGLSTNVGQYTLTIGSVNLPNGVNTTPANLGRYGYSSLTFPPGSGFVNGQESNIMAILTTRRGTDIMVGTFNFAAPPVASNVGVTTDGNGQYILTFTLS